jgi:hypothetical protein
MDWIVALALFVTSYFVWSISQPVVTVLITNGQQMVTDTRGNTLLSFVGQVFTYGILICAIVPVIYLILASVRSEVDESQIYM